MREIPLAELGPASRGVYVRGAWSLYVALPSGDRASFVWGTPDEAEAAHVVATWRTELDAPPHAALLDTSGLEHLAPATLAPVHAFLQDNHATLSTKITRQAIVTPRNLAGTTIAGYFAIYDAPYASLSFVSTDEALRWLRCDDDLAAQIDQLRALREDAIVARLRAQLSKMPLTEATLESAARALALSSRTLQRRLGEAGTRFADELARAQVARAQRLMLESDLKLTAIALEVGCASPSVFSELFRRMTGVSPSEWQKHRR